MRSQNIGFLYFKCFITSVCENKGCYFFVLRVDFTYHNILSSPCINKVSLLQISFYCLTYNTVEDTRFLLVMGTMRQKKV